MMLPRLSIKVIKCIYKIMERRSEHSLTVPNTHQGKSPVATDHLHGIFTLVCSLYLQKVVAN